MLGARTSAQYFYVGARSENVSKHKGLDEQCKPTHASRPVPARLFLLCLVGSTLACLDQFTLQFISSCTVLYPG